MEVHYENVECPDHEDPASHRAVFYSANDGSRRRLSLADINDLFCGKAEQDRDFEIPRNELEKARLDLMPVFKPAEF